MGNKRGSTATRGAKKAQQQQRKKRRFGGETLDFLKGVRAELRRVNWPDREQLKQSTAVVIVIVLALGVYIAAWDYVFGFLSRLIFSA